jgi:predicted nuclease of predicted toxin-antitoxin system
VLPLLFADECIRAPLVGFLRVKGADIVAIADFGRGTEDPRVLREAVLRQRILLTADYDFGDLQFRDSSPALGIVLIALNRLKTPAQGPIVLEALLRHKDELIGGFLNIEPGRTRVRRLDHSTGNHT